ncbi:MAG: hypothetical protein EZS28_009791 [Streblomastix strix]|uniref:Uncharacterized protein n=1 Tax=Streblomastix strix TaxID=222440 RepID=A0A5J4WI56_9EUKA|nr:MAG: hypothetical protein EZS28_009791 [Streblomastix strix]
MSDTQIETDKKHESLLDLFWLLDSNDKSAALQGISKILSRVSQKQKEKESELESDIDESLQKLSKQLRRDEQGKHCIELDYCIMRLIRGLGTPRSEVRHTYSVALCILLAQYRLIISSSFVLLVMYEQLQISHQLKDKERYDMRRGRMLCIMSLWKSGILLQNKQEIATDIIGIRIQIAETSIEICKYSYRINYKGTIILYYQRQQ